MAWLPWCEHTQQKPGTGRVQPAVRSERGLLLAVALPAHHVNNWAAVPGLLHTPSLRKSDRSPRFHSQPLQAGAGQVTSAGSSAAPLHSRPFQTLNCPCPFPLFPTTAPVQPLTVPLLGLLLLFQPYPQGDFPSLLSSPWPPKPWLELCQPQGPTGPNTSGLTGVPGDQVAQLWCCASLLVLTLYPRSGVCVPGLCFLNHGFFILTY